MKITTKTPEIDTVPFESLKAGDCFKTLIDDSIYVKFCRGPRQVENTLNFSTWGTSFFQNVYRVIPVKTELIIG